MKSNLNNNILIKIENNFKNNKGLLYAFLTILLGFSIGSIAYLLSDSNLHTLITTEITHLNSDVNFENFFEIFTQLTLKGIPFIILLLFLSSSVCGKILTFALVTLKFSGIGMLVAYFCSFSGLKGFEYTFLVFMPGKLFYIISTLILTECCYDFSNEISNRIHGKSSKLIDIKSYSIKIVICFFIYLFSFTLDALNICVFSSLFK